ncbi:MAG: leucyl aminopeptidase [Actinomycetota bacterium]|nr:leucyl aminopeptidase [Actinomycetota bacterium]
MEITIEIIASQERATEVAVDVLTVGAQESDGSYELSETARSIDGLMDGRLSDYLNRVGFKSRPGETVVLPTWGAVTPSAVAVVGLGGAGDKAVALRRAAGGSVRRLTSFGTAGTALHEGAGSEGAAAVVEGVMLGAYQFNDYKSEPRPHHLSRIVVLGDIDEEDLDRARARARAAILARDLTNEPASGLFPSELADRAIATADAWDLEAEILDEDALAANGYGGILAVARGSDRPPRLITLRYSQATDGGEKLALVGKGVTFDSGGLSLKDAKSMETMKTDMAGGAAVIGAMSTLSTLRPPVEVVAFIPATENMPGGRALKPGDVITHYGGKTSEVLNTDAEGRLILADALARASEDNPAAIVDTATLTGAVMVALGKKVAGLFSNDDGLADQIQAAAERTGERFWRMPLFDDYRKSIDSEIADIKNTGDRWGGAIFAALYLRDFVGAGIPWAHLDIAGPGRAESDQDEVVKGGSGFAARTLVAWIEGRSS